MAKKTRILILKTLVACTFLVFALFPIILFISSSLKKETEVFDYRIIPQHIKRYLNHWMFLPVSETHFLLR